MGGCSGEEGHLTHLGIAFYGASALALSAALAVGWSGVELSPATGPVEVLAISTPTQGKDAKKQAPVLIGPKRSVSVFSIDIKLTTGPAPSGFSFGAGLNNSSASATAADGYIDIPNPDAFGEGLTEVMVTSLTESKGFIVIDLPPGTLPGTGSPDEEVPQYLLKAVIVEMSCRKRSGGLSIGDISGGQGQYENKVTMDVRLVDPLTNVVVDSVKATGRKTSKSSIFGATKYSTWDPSTKILDLSYGDFEDSPLAEATRLATQDAVKKLMEKAAKRPWEAKVVKVVQEESGPEFYLNVTGDCGLKIGDQLELFRLGEVLTDEKTFKVLGRSRLKTVCSLEVFIVEDEHIVCRIPVDTTPPKIDEGSNFIVRLKKLNARPHTDRSAFRPKHQICPDLTQCRLANARDQWRQQTP